jgi:hypothetical protein
MTKSEILKTLFTKYNLIFDSQNPESKDNDVYIHKHYKIITRTGIEKIQKAAGIKIKYEVVSAGPSHFFLKGYGENSSGEVVETFASASEDTSQNKYYPEMAEKRCMSRIVLKLAGLYEYGVFGQDEADDFSERGPATKAASYKGK